MVQNKPGKIFISTRVLDIGSVPGQTIPVKDDGDVTGQHVDDFRADFSSLQEEKKFNFAIILGDVMDGDSVMISEPKVDAPSPGPAVG